MEPTLLYVDLFAGAGGTSTGVSMASTEHGPAALVIAAVNHDAIAIASHAANHPETAHFVEDIRTLSMGKLLEVVNKYRTMYPNAYLVLWASLECTNFSKAKGGMSRDADSRTLAEHLFRYYEALNPDYIQIENVAEFQKWGPLLVKEAKTEEGYLCCPLDIKRKKKGVVEINPTMVPDPQHLQEYYNEWVKSTKSYGYDYDFRILNSADFGAYTSRPRLFIQFAKEGFPIVWPEPTHAKKVTPTLFSSGLKPWKPVKDVLDFATEGQSIFTRKTPLVDASLERIYAGLVKFVAGGKKSFISQRNSGEPSSKVCSVDSPARTLTQTGGNLELTQCFLASYYKNGSVTGIDKPSHTLTTRDRLSLISAQYNSTDFLTSYYKNVGALSLDKPSPVLPTKDHISLISAKFIMRDFTSGGFIASIDNPAGAITPSPKMNLVDAQFILRDFKTPTHSSVEKPVGSITGTPKMHLVQSKFIMDTRFNNVGQSVEEPLHTITANRKYHYIVNPAYGGNIGSVEQPCCVIVARQDKAPLYLIEAKCGTFSVPIYETDSEVMRRIKQFMAAYNIVDITMRMLLIREMIRITGFPDGYVLKGSSTNQKKFIGNAVPCLVPKAIAEALATELNRVKQIAV